jgi:hypothetical protein
MLVLLLALGVFLSIGVSQLYAIYIIEENNRHIVSGKGTLVFLSFEGGFYGIISDSGEHYDLLDFRPDIAVGSQIYFGARKLDVMSFHMWGTPVSIIYMLRVP